MWGSPHPPSSLGPKATTRETSETDDEGKIVYEMSDSVVVVVVVVAFQEL